jgi:hypothetical protein
VSPDTIEMCDIVKVVMNLQGFKKAWTFLYLERKKRLVRKEPASRHCIKKHQKTPRR